MADKKHKPSITPEAAKVLEQYRNAGKPKSADGVDPAEADGNGAARPASPPPPSPMRRSGTRGK